MRYCRYRRNPTDREIQYLRYLVGRALANRQPLDERDMILLQSFLDALDEQKNRPHEDVKDREWRAQIYRRFLDDPEALEQFTKQALQKFGPERLSLMVAPELQEKIARRAFDEMPINSIYQILVDNNRIGDLIDYIMDHNPEFIRSRIQSESEESVEDEEELVEDEELDEDEERHQEL